MKIFVIFVSLFIMLYLALNYYIGLRGWQFFGSKLVFLQAMVYWIIFAIVVLSIILAMFGRKILPDFLRNGLYFIGYYWMAALVYFTLLIVVIDLFRLIDRRIGLLRVFENNAGYSIGFSLLIISLVIGLLVYGSWNGRNIQVTSYRIHIPKPAVALKKLHIVMISDLHLMDIGTKRRRRIIDTVNRLGPELVLIPGDIVPPDTEKVVEDFRTIKSRYGVYACLGNHDYYDYDLSQLIKQLQQSGIHVLRDSSEKVADSFYIVGRDDKTYDGVSKKRRQTISSLMAGINPQLPVIMLDHQPVDMEAAEQAGVDLQLSGHTHRGQFFPFNLITQRVFKIDYGYLKTGSLQVIVSSGAGIWGPQIRIGSISEVVDIKVTFDKQ